MGGQKTGVGWGTGATAEVAARGRHACKKTGKKHWGGRHWWDSVGTLKKRAEGNKNEYASRAAWWCQRVGENAVEAAPHLLVCWLVWVGRHGVPQPLRPRPRSAAGPVARRPHACCRAARGYGGGGWVPGGGRRDSGGARGSREQLVGVRSADGGCAEGGALWGSWEASRLQRWLVALRQTDRGWPAAASRDAACSLATDSSLPGSSTVPVSVDREVGQQGATPARGPWWKGGGVGQLAGCARGQGGSSWRATRYARQAHAAQRNKPAAPRPPPSQAPHPNAPATLRAASSSAAASSEGRSSRRPAWQAALLTRVREAPAVAARPAGWLKSAPSRSSSSLRTRTAAGGGGGGEQGGALAAEEDAEGGGCREHTV